MIKRLILPVAFLFAAGFFNATMDKLQFHYSKSVFANFNPNYWNPKISWRNKWKIDNEDNPIVGKERFLGSSTIFIKFTDAWHLAQSFMLLCFFMSALFYKKFETSDAKKWRFWLDLLILYAAFSLGFNLFFDYIF